MSDSDKIKIIFKNVQKKYPEYTEKLCLTIANNIFINQQKRSKKWTRC